MAIVCLDTDIIVGILRGRRTVASEYLSYDNFGAVTTIVTLMELYYGAFKSDKASDVGLVDSLSKDLPIINMSEDDAKLTAEMMADLDSTGVHVEVNDILIAAICINRGMHLMTDNIRHFSRMEKFGLIVQKGKEN